MRSSQLSDISRDIRKSITGTDWYKKRKKTQKRYESGEITDLERGFSNVADSVEALYTPVDAALSATYGLLPETVQEGVETAVGAAGEAITGTDMYQSAAQLAEENPRTAGFLSDVAGVAGALPLLSGAKKAASPSLRQRIVENAPNELPRFYTGMPIPEMVAAVPSTVISATKEALSPTARASAREGVNTRLRNVVASNNAISDLYAKQASGVPLSVGDKARIKGLELRHGRELEKIAKTRGSFLEGQLEQSSLFAVQKTGKVPDALQTFHSNYSFSDIGPLSRSTLDSGFQGRQDLNWVSENTKKFLMGSIKSTYKVKDPDKFSFVVKKNNAFTDLTQEARMKIASKTGKRMYQVKQVLEEMGSKQKGFKSIDELKDFVALRFLEDKSKVRQYLGYKKKIENGEKLTKSQIKAYGNLVGVVKNNRDNIAFVNKKDGQVAVRSSHVSQSKAAGGVGDIFVFDLKGNVMHTMTDKNDIAAIPKTDIELEFPKGKKMITITEPYTYNVFGKEIPKANNTPDVKAFRQGIEDKTGVPFESSGAGRAKQDLMRQVSQGIENFQPTVTSADRKAAAATAAAPVGLLTGNLAARQQEEEQGGR